MKRLKGIALFIGIVAVLALGGYYYYQTEKEIETCSDRIQKLEMGLRKQFKSALYLHDSLMLRLISEPFTWAIRQHLLTDDISTIHQYLGQFVKHDAIKMIVVMNVDSKIISCTDKKLEDRLFSDVFPEEQFDSDEFFVVSRGADHFTFHPIMGFDRRLATLVIVYNTGKDDVFTNLISDYSS